MASYLEILEATTLLSETIGNEPWLLLTDAVKTASLVQASLILDSNFDWFGNISSENQDLRWPRTGVQDRDGRTISSDTVPNVIKHAVVALASYLTQTGGVNVIANNVESLKVGPISLSFDSKESINDQLVPRYLISMLSPFGIYTGPTDGSSAYNVKVLR